LLPLIDSEVSTGERIRKADTFLNTRVLNNEQAIASLIHSEDPWLKSCAAYVVGKLAIKSFDPEVERLSGDPDTLLQKKLSQARAMLKR
jgi:hypothetical protein